MIVGLTYAELLVSYLVAGQRQTMNMKRSINAKHGAPEGAGGEELHILAAQGEMAVAKALNLFWSGTVGEYGAIDVGGAVEVRTRSQQWHELIIHEDDRDDVPFVLVLGGNAPLMFLAGWIWGREGKQPKFWKDPAKGRPAYFVPRSGLRPMADLVAAFGCFTGPLFMEAG